MTQPTGRPVFRLLNLAFLAACIAVPTYASAGVCKGPTPEKQAELSTYMSKRYRAPSGGQITLAESAQANEACYWKLRYKVSTSKTELTVYLSPDGQFLAPTLYDLRIDPLVEQQAQAAKVIKTLAAGDPPSLGPAAAPITIVEFSDFQCPFCKRFTEVLEKDLTEEDRKSIRILFREFPLPMHPWAKTAAEMAGCAALQSDSAFWKVHDYLFANQQTITTENVHENIMSFASTNAGIDKTQLQTCLDKKLAVGGVEQDMEMGTKNGVKATPTLFINGTRYEGMKDAAQLRSIIADIQKSIPSEVKLAEAK
jgi:protein-disulfide isomerase